MLKVNLDKLSARERRGFEIFRDYLRSLSPEEEAKIWQKPSAEFKAFVMEFMEKLDDSL